MQTIEYSFFSGVKDNAPKRRAFAGWPEMVQTFQASEERAESGGTLWSPCVYAKGERRGVKDGQGEEVSCLVFDFDQGPAPGVLRKLWEPFTFLIHSTRRSTPETPRWRAVFPLEEPVPVPLWPETWARCAHHLGGGYVDPACKDASRLYFFPQHAKGVEPVFLVHAGRRLDPALLAPVPALPPAKEAFRPADERWKPEDLLEEALDKIGELGGRDNAGFYLAGQLRDEGYTRGEVESVLLAYQRLVPSTDSKGEYSPFTEREALHNVESAFAHPPRSPRAKRLAAPPDRGAKGGAKSATATLKRPKEKAAGAPGPNGAGSPETPQDSSPGAADPVPPAGPFTEKQLADRFVEQMRLRYMTTDGGVWWRYEEGFWSATDRQAMLSVMERFLAPYQTDKQYARLVSNVLAVAGMRLYVPLARLNAHPEWISLTNGILDVAEHKFLEHSPTYLLTSRLPVRYDPEAVCPRWTQFLHEVLVDRNGRPSVEMASLLQEWFGYCLVPDTRAQTSMWWLGGGANGKGVATRILETLIGDRQRVGLDVASLTEAYHRASVYGKLLAIVSEMDPRSMLKGANWFKAIVAGDTINARTIGKDVFSFVPFARVLVTVNELPKTYDRTFGYFRRLKLLFFRIQLAEEKQDRDLLEKLLQEIPGIFNWALLGLYRLESRRWKFSQSEDADETMEEYRYEQDAAARFVDDWCAREEEAEEANSSLWGAYQSWCKANGEHYTTNIQFGRDLTRLGFGAKMARDGETIYRARTGIKLLVRRGASDQLDFGGEEY